MKAFLHLLYYSENCIHLTFMFFQKCPSHFSHRLDKINSDRRDKVGLISIFWSHLLIVKEYSFLPVRSFEFFIFLAAKTQLNKS